MEIFSVQYNKVSVGCLYAKQRILLYDRWESLVVSHHVWTVLALNFYICQYDKNFPEIYYNYQFRKHKYYERVAF